MRTTKSFVEELAIYDDTPTLVGDLQPVSDYLTGCGNHEDAFTLLESSLNLSALYDLSKAMLARIKELENTTVHVPMSNLAIKKMDMAIYAIQPVGVLIKTEHDDIGVVTHGGAFVWLHDNKVLKSILGVTP